MKRQLTTFAFAGFLGLCCIGCPPADQDSVEPVTDTPAETELNTDDIDAGTVPVEDDSNTTAAEGETTGLEFPTEEETPQE